MAVNNNKELLEEIKTKINNLPTNLHDTSSVTATADDILTGYTIVNADGEEVQGTMANRGSALNKTVTSNGNVSVGAGYHSGGTLKISVPTNVDYSWVNTSAGNVAGGYAFINSKGQLEDGTMTSNTAETITLNSPSSSYRVPDGYHTGNGAVKLSLSTVTLPTPTVSTTANVKSTGVIEASYTLPNAGYAAAATKKTSTYSLTTGAGGTYTPGTTEKIISAGTYLTSDLIVAGDANLSAENIKKGERIFGVTGTYEGEDITTKCYSKFIECTSDTLNIEVDMSSVVDLDTAEIIRVCINRADSLSLSQNFACLIHEIMIDTTYEECYSLTYTSGGIGYEYGDFSCSYGNDGNNKYIIEQNTGVFYGKYLFTIIYE